MKNYKEVAQSWLTGNFDEQTKAEVKQLMETDPVALEDAFYRNLEFFQFTPEGGATDSQSFADFGLVSLAYAQGVQYMPAFHFF